MQLFERAVVTAREQLASGYAERAARAVHEALALWRGTPLVELDGWADADAERVRLGVLRDAAVDLLLDAMLRSGHHATAAADAGRLVEEAPYREARWALWARALYADGRQAEALRALQRLREVLRNDLGLLPCAEIETLELAMLEHDPSLQVASAVTRDDRCPWRGLLPYEPANAAAFFGRSLEVDVCLARLGSDPWLVVVGRSGSGKSSMVRAGLVPRLIAAGACVDIVVPGDHPLAALSAVNEDSLLVVDQAEEVITQCRDPDERHAFFDHLARRQGGVIVVARADMMDALTAFTNTPNSSSAACSCCARWMRRGCAPRWNCPLRQRHCDSSQGWWSCWSKNVAESPARCLCYRTLWPRPGSASRATHLSGTIRSKSQRRAVGPRRTRPPLMTLPEVLRRTTGNVSVL